MYVLLPALPLALPPLVVAYWAIFSRNSSRRWTHAEYACMISFASLVVLRCFHPAVQHYYQTRSFFIQLWAFVIIMNVIAVPLGWSVAALGREWIEKRRIESAEE